MKTNVSQPDALDLLLRPLLRDPDQFLPVVPLLVLSIALYILYRYLRPGRADRRRIILDVLLLIWLNLLVVALLVPIQISHELSWDARVRQILWNLEPFKYLKGALRFGTRQSVLLDIYNLAANFLLFLPLPILLRLRNPDGRGQLIISLLASAAAEPLQLGLGLLLGMPNRVFDIDDILMNVAGALFGWLVIGLSVKLLQLRRSQ